jgi:putative solute:sodium symporter small subunit
MGGPDCTIRWKSAKSFRRNIVSNKNPKKEYWKKNLQYLVVLLSIWFTVSFGFSVILVDVLDKIKIGGFKLGFWFSQQGSIVVFVIIIFVYVHLMNKLDKKYDVEENEEQKQ